MAISIFRTLLYHTTLKQDSEGQSVVMEAPAAMADILPGIDEERETHPTREDVRDLLETKIFFFNFSFNAHQGYTVGYDEVTEHLYKEYHLYKVRSTIVGRYSDPYTLTPQTYIAYIKEDRASGIARAKEIVRKAKESLLELQKHKIAQVHAIASLGIVYDDVLAIDK